MFEWTRDLNGRQSPQIQPLYIPTGTAIDYGEIVDFTPGTGVIALGANGTDFDGPAIGVAMSAHEANSGTEIKVSTSPTAVYRHKCDNILTATGGSATTFVVATLVPQTDNLWIGGYLEVVSCAADPSMKGKRIKITDSTGTTGTLTFDAQPAAFASGDTAKLCPGPLAIGTTAWNLDSDGLNVDFAKNTTTGESLVLVGADPENMIAEFMLRRHRFGYGPDAS
jgi:hypothetical protein